MLISHKQLFKWLWFFWFPQSSKRGWEHLPLLFINLPCFFPGWTPTHVEKKRGCLILSRSHVSVCFALMGKMGHCQGRRVWAPCQLWHRAPSPGSVPQNANWVPYQNMKNVDLFGPLWHALSCNMGTCLLFAFVLYWYSCCSNWIPGLHLCQNVHSVLLFSTRALGRSSIMDCEPGCKTWGFLSGVSIELRSYVAQLWSGRGDNSTFPLDLFLQGLFPKTTGDVNPWAAKRRWGEKWCLIGFIHNTGAFCFQNMCLKIAFLEISMEDVGLSIYCTTQGQEEQKWSWRGWANQEKNFPFR